MTKVPALLILGLLCTSPSVGQCVALSIQQPAELQSTRALVLRPSVISARAIPSIPQRVYREEPLEEVTRRLDETLLRTLRPTGLFRSIELSSRGPIESSIALDIELIHIWQGSRSTIVPLVARSDPSVLEISGTITTGDVAGNKPVAEFMCRSLTGGVILKSKTWMLENIDKLAEGVKKLLLTVREERRTVGAAITATPTTSSELEMIWAYAPDAWAKVARSMRLVQEQMEQRGLKLSPQHGAVSHVDPEGTVVALLITEKNIDRLVRGYSKMLSDGKRTLFPRFSDTYITGEKLYQIFHEAEGSNQWMVWIWYARKGITNWNHEDINATTALIDLNTAVKSKPIQSLIPAPYLPLSEIDCHDLLCEPLEQTWVYNSVIFVFPGDHNTPARSELRTQLDNHSVVVRF